MVAAAVAGSSVRASPAPSPSPLLNTNLYWGTFRPSSSCANPKSCTTFDAALTNTSKVTLNSFMINVLDDRFTTFNIQGAACKNIGTQFGASFRNAWMCLDLHIPPGATVVGSGIATHPLTANTTARFDWSNKGGLGGLFPDSSEDVHFAPLVTPLARLDLQIAETNLEHALFEEQKFPGATVGEVQAAAKRGITALGKAKTAVTAAGSGGAFQPGVEASITKSVDEAIADDKNAESASTVRTADVWMQRASVAKVGALVATEGAVVRLNQP